MSITKTADLIYAFRFLRLLTKPWKDMPAFELGLIDASGKLLKKASTPEEKDAYSMFNRLVFNIRRILQKLPFGNMRIANYAAALFLIKENSNLSVEDLETIMEGFFGEEFPQLNESVDAPLSPGAYTIVSEQVIIPSTGESIDAKGSKVILDIGSEPVDTILGEHIYKVHHKPTNQIIFVSQGELIK